MSGAAAPWQEFSTLLQQVGIAAGSVADRVPTASMHFEVGIWGQVALQQS
jgi:hypothetical protein